jgi:hypothetical protein
MRRYDEGDKRIDKEEGTITMKKQRKRRNP